MLESVSMNNLNSIVCLTPFILFINNQSELISGHSNLDEMVHAEYLQHKITINSRVSYLLPSKDGPGITARMTVDLLARTHNDLIEKCRSLQGDRTE